jgi:hypothetical protein
MKYEKNEKIIDLYVFHMVVMGFQNDELSQEYVFSL